MQKKQKETLQSPEPAPSPSEVMVDTAPVISPSLTPPLEPEVAAAEGEEAPAEVSISAEELKELNQAVQLLKADQDRTELEELKEDREEYIEVQWGCL